MRAVVTRFLDRGLIPNKSKCELKKTMLRTIFFEHVFSERGVGINPDQVDALLNMTPPTNATEVRKLA